MRTRTTIVFNATERKAFASAARAANVGLHGPQDNPAVTRPKLIYRLTMKGFEHNEKHLAESMRALYQAREACVIESDPNYFLLPPSKRPKEKPDPADGVPLVLDPLGMVKFLIDTRKQFIADIDEALVILTKAIGLSGQGEDDDPDFWEMDEDADDYVPDFSGGGMTARWREQVEAAHAGIEV